MSSENDPFVFRAFEPDDAAALARIYRDAVLKTGATAYDATQVAMWSSFASEPEFTTGLACGTCIVALSDGVIAGFGQLEPADCVHLLYVSPDFARRGIGSALLARLEAVAAGQGVAQLQTNASHLSRPVFARAGWQLDQVEITERNGVHFERFCMSKRLEPVPGSRT
jgi:putative acetyltransferase